MDLSMVNTLLELTGGPAFAVRDGRLAACTASARELGLADGQKLAELLPDALMPEPGDGALESDVLLCDRIWTLRAAQTEDVTLCYLRPGASLTPPPNEATLLYVAGSIRQALQDLYIALDGMGGADSNTNPALSHQAALAMRSVYRLRRTAGDLELFSRLRAGTYRLNRQRLPLTAAADRFCRETADLLQAVDLHLHWKLPETEANAVLDWPLAEALLRELLVNAAAHAPDRQLYLELRLVGRRRVCFSIRNRAEQTKQNPSFHRYAMETRSDLEGGVGLGLSLVSQGADCHGGTLLLSTEDDGWTTALLTLTLGEQEDSGSWSPIQFPQAEEHPGLTAFSTILPPEAFLPENL